MNKTILSIRNVNNSSLVTATNGYCVIEFLTETKNVLILLFKIKIQLWKNSINAFFRK